MTARGHGKGDSRGEYVGTGKKSGGRLQKAE